MDEFWEQEGATYKKSLILPQNVLEFLASEEGKEAIEKALENPRLSSVIEFNTSTGNLSAKILADSDHSVKKTFDRISKLAHEESVEVEQCNLTLKSKTEWTALCENIKEETGVYIHGADEPITLVVGFTDKVKSSAKKLQQFLDENSIRTEQLICQPWIIKQYIKQFRGEDLRKIETDLAQSSVKITDDDTEYNTFYISGRGEGLQEAKKLLNEIIRKTVVTNFIIEQPGLRRTSQRTGAALVKSTSTDQKCLIFTESMEGMMQYVTSQGQTIFGKNGNITEEQVSQTVFFKRYQYRYIVIDVGVE